MKRILPEFEFTDEQLNIVRSLAKSCGLCTDTVKILYGRGIRDEGSINAFMHPGKNHFISPFKMSGMDEAVKLITLAKGEEWSVAVFGDYDADGICAATILVNSLKDFGIEPYVFVPERKDGYGFSTKTIDDIFDECFPQLFITVDCGISCAEEVEYLKEQGAEVIVTDHHELPEKLPDCICINPKFNDGYPYDNLCGAGVAFKLGCALVGEEAFKYLDYVAIATVADSVPLVGENRDLVYEGLKIINQTPRDNYSQFINKGEKTTSHSLAFSIAPKINAAGRMGDAHAALSLFSETDKEKIFTLSSKLCEYNIERQKYCDELYISAKEMLNARQNIGSIIVLCNENWNSGFVGIVAARLSDEYSRPTVLFVKNGDMYKGSARSVDGVNIFECLRACGEYIAEFGGHSQAAGVNVTQENYAALAAALEEYVSSHYGKEIFVPSVCVNGKFDGELSSRFVKELEYLEPFGVGNRRPMFEADVDYLSTRPIKLLSPHITAKFQNLDMMFFGGARYASLLECSVPKKLIFEYNTSVFRGREYVKGFVRDVICDAHGINDGCEEIGLYTIDLLSFDKPTDAKTISKNEIELAMAQEDLGSVFVAWSPKSLARYKNAAALNVELFVQTQKNSLSTVIIAPTRDVDLSGFKKAYILDNPFGVNLPQLKGLDVNIAETAELPDCYKNLSCKREDLLKIFSELCARAGELDGVDAVEVARKNPFNCSKNQTLFAIKVFEQLALVEFVDGVLKINRGIKTELGNSEIYKTVLKLQDTYERN